MEQRWLTSLISSESVDSTSTPVIMSNFPKLISYEGKILCQVLEDGTVTAEPGVTIEELAKAFAHAVIQSEMMNRERLRDLEMMKLLS